MEMEKEKTHKICTCCEGSFPIETYHYANKKKGIRKTVCKQCSYDKAKAFIEKDPIAHYHYMQKYYRENPERFPGNYVTKNIPMKCGVYEIVCLLTDDSYVGCSKNIRGRMYKHRKASGRGKQQNLYKLIKEYGWQAFDVRILELCDKEELFERETYWINELQPNLNKYQKNK